MKLYIYKSATAPESTWDLIARQTGGALFESEGKQTFLMNAESPSSNAVMNFGNLVSSCDAIMDKGKHRVKLTHDQQLLVQRHWGEFCREWSLPRGEFTSSIQHEVVHPHH